MTENIEEINALLARVTMLLSFVLEVDRANGLYDLVIMLSKDEKADDLLTVRFKNVAGLKLDVDAAGWVQFMMLRVDVGEESFERRYIVSEHEHGVVNFRCSEIETD